MFVRSITVLLFAASAAFVGARAADEHEGHKHGEASKDAPAPAKNQAESEKQAVEKQKASYPLKTCVVTGGELGGMGDPIDFVHEGTLVRFCCKGCIKKFQKDPDTYLKKIEAAAKAAETGKLKTGAEDKSDSKKSKDDHKRGGTPSSSGPAKSGGHSGHGGGCNH